MSGFQRWRWQIQDAEYEGEQAFNAGRSEDYCRFKRADMVEAWRRGFGRAKRRKDDE